MSLLVSLKEATCGYIWKGVYDRFGMNYFLSWGNLGSTGKTMHQSNAVFHLKRNYLKKVSWVKCLLKDRRVGDTNLHYQQLPQKHRGTHSQTKHAQRVLRGPQKNYTVTQWSKIQVISPLEISKPERSLEVARSNRIQSHHYQSHARTTMIPRGQLHRGIKHLLLSAKAILKWEIQEGLSCIGKDTGRSPSSSIPRSRVTAFPWVSAL